jgi:integrase
MDYYSAGLCRRCHQYAPQSVDSCLDCYAWGAWRHFKWLCKGCYSWRWASSTVDSCGSCHRVVPLDGNRFCRLCRKQATRMATPGRSVDVINLNRNGQQLFLADMFQKRGATRRITPTFRRSALPSIRPVPYLQGVLFPAQRDLRRTGVAIAAARTVANNDLTVALDEHTHEHAERHGWGTTTRHSVRQGIHVLLALQDTPGAAITTTEVAQLTGTRLPVGRICAVLAEAGMLIDDREPAVRRWFRTRIAGLPTAMHQETSTWFTILEQGSAISPRRTPRSVSTLRSLVTWVLPALATWSASGHESLREISHDDVLAVLPERGLARAEMVHGLRSLFTVLKQQKAIFANPTARIPTGKPPRGQPLPIDLAALREALDSPDPARAALVALLAFHGLRSGQLRRLMLTDLQDSRLHVDGRSLLLAPAVQQRIDAWLAYRNARWPNTANPYLFVTLRSALHTTPAGPHWIFIKVALPGAAQAIREDRILHEAIATGGDARRLTDLFGLSIAAATRYTDTVDPTTN